MIHFLAGHNSNEEGYYPETYRAIYYDILNYNLSLLIDCFPQTNFETYEKIDYLLFVAVSSL